MTGYSLSYILDSLSLDTVMMIHRYGLEYEETKAIILLNKYAEALSGKKRVTGDKPDLKKFSILYGDRIKTPNKKE